MGGICRTSKARPGEELLTIVRTVLPGYFRRSAIPLKAAGTCGAGQYARGAIRFLVNEAFVRSSCQRGSAGRVDIRVVDNKNPFGQIVGVVGDVKEGSLDKEPEPTVSQSRHLSYTSMTFCGA